MAANPNIVFYLSRGNPYNAPVGMGTDQQVFGKSVGGQIFTQEILLTGQTIQTSLKSGSYDLFDPIVASDLVKNEVNYRVVYIFNPSVNHIVLDTISANIIQSPYLDFDICEVDIATEGFFTLGELNRVIPAKPGTAANTSMFLDDEYDSTNKLANLTFKKTLDGSDLPVDIPTNCALKIWIRRKCALPKAQIPDGEFYEGIQLTVNEFNDEFSTSWDFNYIKQDGRIPLSNWYDYTITPGSGNAIVMKELLPKELDLSTFNLIKTFVKDEKILIFYFTQLGITKNYHLLVIEPHDNIKKNKYIHVQFTFQDNVDTATETLKSKDIATIFKSYYDPAKYYIFWKDVVQVNASTQQFLGLETTYDRISVDELTTFIWTDSKSFDAVIPGYEFRRMVSYSPANNKVVRSHTELVNVEQFDDLFIMFAKDTHNAIILDIPNLKLNRNQLLYLFEKDILSDKNNKFNTFPGEGAQVLSHRLYPQSLPKLNQISSFNNVKNSPTALLISDNNNVDTVHTSSLRTIKTLLDGTRYLDFNSVHLREYKITNSFVTHDLPTNDTDLTSLFTTTSFAITNDTNIYEEKKTFFLTSNTMSSSTSASKPWFQQNIIDTAGIGSMSIPVEWVDRIYKDSWITILSSAPVNGNMIYKIEYNFARNLWKAEWTDADGVQYNKTYNYLFGEQGTISTSGTSATPTPASSGSSGNPELISTGKVYGDLVVQDMPYVLEPDTYQPFSVKIATVQVFSMSGSPKYKANIQVYFKGNTTPIIDFATTTTDITSLSYVFVNPNKTFNMRMNYFEVADAKTYPIEYVVKNLHKSLLNNLTVVFGDEFKTNVQLTPRQADFRYYRKVSISGLEDVPSISDKSIVIPIVLYGNGYKQTDNILLNKISVQFPFDFKKLAINDKSLRFFFDSSFDKPLPFKVAHYDYEDEYAVIWVRLSNWTGTNKNLFMYYSKVNISDTKLDIRAQYVSLKNNMYDPFVLGAWYLDNIFFDERLTFSDGMIYNMGEPVIYEKTSNTISLTRIDKEYMYGIAKVYKSNKFVLEMDVPAEESLLFDPSTKDDFVKFIKDVATIIKPSYTEIHDVRQFGFDVLEAGEGNMGETTNKRVAGLVATTPNANVMTYYDRVSDTKFNLLTSFNGYSKSIDWVIAKPIDTPIFKSGTMKINGKLKSETIKFETPFKNTDYFLFLSSPVNQKLYWQLLCNNRFTVTASHYLLKEVSWMAFHRDMFGGVFTPNSIFVGKRDMTGSVETSGGEGPTIANLPYWYNNELLVRPEMGVGGDPGSMIINPTTPGYSLLLSSNENINTYWDGKEINQFRVKTSSPETCTIHWLVIQNGVEWWQEIVT